MSLFVQTEEVAPPVSEKNLAEEQVIRQQLLAKQKQLLELQQKKIELELEQTKAQLVSLVNHGICISVLWKTFQNTTGENISYEGEPKCSQL